MNEQDNFWINDYADSYIRKNNKFDNSSGIDAWKEMLKKAGAISNILECGSNIGRNINFLNEVVPKADKTIIEISPEAFKTVTSKYSLKDAYNGSIVSSSFGKEQFDFVFTMGVLIHIHPEELIDNMKKVFDYSNKYILFGEYFNRTPVMLEYHGELDKLFKRDFGRMFMANFDVKLVDYGFLWGKVYDDAGFDDVTWWLFEKK